MSAWHGHRKQFHIKFRIKKKRKNMQVVFMDECRDGQGETQEQWLTVASFDAYDDHGVG